MTAFTLAAAQYPIDQLANWSAYAAKLTDWVAAAAQGGAQLALFPEYGAMELAALCPATMGDLASSLAHVASLAGQIDALHADLACAHGLHILAASTPVRLASGAYVNRARLFTPTGQMGWQDKQVMTRFEAEHWGISPGASLRLFDTALGRIGIAICYDSEFPLIARALVEAGAGLILVPSCTDTAHGYWRVRLGCQARAVEGQCYIAQSPTVGEAPWSPAVDVNVGAAGLFAPPDGTFPADGVVAMGAMNAAQWVFGKVNLALVEQLRGDGAVLNHRDWMAQPGVHALPCVDVVELR